MTSSERIEEALVDLAWSLWTELGVRGVVRRHRSWSIDPEALVVLTAVVAERDPRLRDESLDWCVKHYRHLSRSRLRNAVRTLADEPLVAYRRYEATLSAAGVRGWPALAEPWPLRPTSKSELADLGRPALIRVRLRAIFGVSARAELLHTLAWQTRDWASSADLAPLAAYTKRNIDDELDNLIRAGLVQARPAGNRRLVRLRDRPHLEAFVGATPEHFPNWPAILEPLTALLALLRQHEGADPRVQDVEATKLIDALARRPDTADLPALPAPGQGSWQRSEQWGAQLAQRLAAGRALASG